MSNNLSILVFLLALSCSSAKQDKAAADDQVANQTETENTDKGTPVPSDPLPVAIVPATQPATQPPIKTAYSLYSIAKSEASQIRSSGKVVSVSIKPIKVTSALGLLPSIISAKCGETIIAQTKTELLTNSRNNEALYQPSIVIPSDFICDADINVSLVINGYQVELGDVIVADVVSVGKAVEVQ